MDVALRHTPSFGVARVKLGPNEPVKVESGAMYAMSAGVVLESKMEGGFLKSAKRAMLGGESFFVSTYTAPEQGGFVDVAARLPGDLLSVEIAPDRALFVQKGFRAVIDGISTDGVEGVNDAADPFPDVDLTTVDDLGGWDAVNDEFFSDNGLVTKLQADKGLT